MNNGHDCITDTGRRVKRSIASSDWLDGIASDFDSSSVSRVVENAHETAGLTQPVDSNAIPARLSEYESYPQLFCACPECRAIVAVVEEEPINKP